MAAIMTKRGSQDNIITYEFMCESAEDMASIDRKYVTLGSICIVVNDGAMDIYIADSAHEWHSLSIGANGGSGDAGASLLYICANNEVSNGLPNISEPDENTIYLVASGNTSGNLYEEYIYVDGAWEKFGAASIDLSNYATKSELPNMSLYAPKANPVFTGSISMGRSGYTGTGSTALGHNVEASSDYSHAEGYDTEASGDYGTHAEGNSTKASGNYGSHAEGYSTTASGPFGSHAEGYYTVASGTAAHAQGYYTNANGKSTHAAGKSNVTMISYPAWVSDTSYEVGDIIIYNTNTYKCTTANNDNTFDSNNWLKIAQQDTYQAFVVGNGIDNSHRSNALTLDWTGDLHLAGDLYTGANANGTGGAKVATESFVTTRVPAPPVADGTYNLQVVVSSGTATYSWVAAPGSASGVSF